MEARRWPKTRGTIEECRVVEVEERDSDGDQSTSYRVDVTYAYTVSDKAYTASRVSPSGSDWGSNRSRALDHAAQYPKGGNVSVLYNPKDPSEALLETSVGSGPIITLASAPVFFVLAVILFVVLKRRFP
ncbi:MAG: DUF3592 domain-containing protein [bacterium]